MVLPSSLTRSSSSSATDGHGGAPLSNSRYSKRRVIFEGPPLRFGLSFRTAPLNLTLASPTILVRRPFTLWLEAEHWAPGQWVPRNTNSDVLVLYEGGPQWAATFFSYENIAALRLKNQETGECLGGRYMWSTHMILVDEVTRERVEQVVADLMASGEFETAFDGPHEPEQPG